MMACLLCLWVDLSIILMYCAYNHSCLGFIRTAPWIYSRTTLMYPQTPLGISMTPLDQPCWHLQFSEEPSCWINLPMFLPRNGLEGRCSLPPGIRLLQIPPHLMPRLEITAISRQRGGLPRLLTLTPSTTKDLSRLRLKHLRFSFILRGETGWLMVREARMLEPVYDQMRWEWVTITGCGYYMEGGYFLLGAGSWGFFSDCWEIDGCSLSWWMIQTPFSSLKLMATWKWHQLFRKLYVQHVVIWSVALFCCTYSYFMCGCSDWL